MSLVTQTLHPRSLIFSAQQETLVLQSASNETRLSFINSSDTGSNMRFVFGSIDQRLQMYTETISNSYFDVNGRSVVTKTCTPFITYDVYHNHNDLSATNVCDAVVETHGTSITSNLIFSRSSPNKQKLITLYDNNSNSIHEFVGLSVDNTYKHLKYQTPYTDSKHIFYTGTSSSASDELMRIQRDVLGNAQVSIGGSSISTGVGLKVAGNTEITGNLFVNGVDFGADFVKLDPVTNRISSNVMPTGVAYLDPASNQLNTSVIPQTYRDQYLRTSKNFGIGIRNPVQRLHVQGSVAVSDRIGVGTLYPSSRLHVVEGAASIPTAILRNTSGGDVLNTFIQSVDGNTALPVLSVVGTHQGVGICTSTVKSTNALEVAGHIETRTMTATTSILTSNMNVSTRLVVSGETFMAQSPFISSDERLKSNIRLIENPLNKLANIHGYTYNYNYDVATTVAGVLAQEVATVFPEAVTIQPDTDYMSVRYDALVSLLIGAIQELTARVATLEAASS